MYLSKSEIIIILTLSCYLLIGSVMSIIIFVVTYIYLHHFRKSDDYIKLFNIDDEQTLKNAVWLKIAAIILLWVYVYFSKDFDEIFNVAFAKDSAAEENSFIKNIVLLGTYFTLLFSLILTLYMTYETLNENVDNESFSKREKTLFGTLIIDASIGIYYFYHRFLLGDPNSFWDNDMSQVVTNIIIIAIIASSLFWFLIYGSEEEEAKDERDLIVENKGNKIGFYAMQIGVGLLMGQVVLGTIFSHYQLTNVEIVNLLLLVVMASHWAKAAKQLFHYRRGY